MRLKKSVYDKNFVRAVVEEQTKNKDHIIHIIRNGDYFAARKVSCANIWKRKERKDERKSSDKT